MYLNKIGLKLVVSGEDVLWLTYFNQIILKKIVKNLSKVLQICSPERQQVTGSQNMEIYTCIISNKTTKTPSSIAE